MVFQPCCLIVVFLLDVVSTNNCVFKRLDSQKLQTIGSGLQMVFMTGLLLMHLGKSLRGVYARGDVLISHAILRKAQSRLCGVGISNRVSLYYG
jgi:hypothetical protein